MNRRILRRAMGIVTIVALSYCSGGRSNHLSHSHWGRIRSKWRCDHRGLGCAGE